MGIPELEEREKGTEEIFQKIMTENFPKLMSDTKSQIQEVQRTPTSKILQNGIYLGISSSNCRKSKINKIWEKPRGKNSLPIEEQR